MPIRIASILGLLALAGAVGAVAMQRGPDSGATTPRDKRDSFATPSPSDSTSAVVAAEVHRYPVTIHGPAGPPRIETGLFDDAGKPVTVACGTCHAPREADPSNRDASTLDEFHQDLTFEHGTNTCYSCHDQSDMDRLRLADGTGLRYEQVQTLCGQCHGQQATSFAHGAHGGMTGYWDLTRGPRQRNGCTICHDPHRPAIAQMTPTFKPRDRFLSPPIRPGLDHE